MQNLYSCLTELLGRPEVDPAFAEFLAKVEGPPKLLRDRKHHREHSFSDSGFALSVGEKGFVSAFLHIATAATKSGSVKPFIGDLPFGVCASDSRREVERKIGKTPVRIQLVASGSSDVPTDYWDDYECDRFNLRFMFSSEHEGLSAIAVRLTEDPSLH
jgi:hypothetical protein